MRVWGVQRVSVCPPHLSLTSHANADVSGCSSERARLLEKRQKGATENGAGAWRGVRRERGTKQLTTQKTRACARGRTHTVPSCKSGEESNLDGRNGRHSASGCTVDRTGVWAVGWGQQRQKIALVMCGGSCCATARVVGGWGPGPGLCSREGGLRAIAIIRGPWPKFAVVVRVPREGG